MSVPSVSVDATATRPLPALAELEAKAPPGVAFGRQRPAQLVRLEAAMAQEADPVKVLFLAAEHASLLARHGFQEEAELALADVRRRHDVRPHRVLTPLVNLADGIVTHATLGAAHAVVKLRRAHALAGASRHAPTQALVAAWLAHCLWNQHDVEAAIPHIRDALNLAAPDDHKARSRVCLVVAEIVALAGDLPGAERWFAAARQHATDAGDDATKSALAFNLLTVQLLLLRDAVLGGSRSAAPLRVTLHGSISQNVDRALGVRVDDLTLRVRATLSSLLDRPAESLALFEERRRLALASAPRAPHPVEPVWLAHEAWCLQRVGRAQEAADRVMGAVAALAPGSHGDDVATVHAIAARVLATFDPPSSERYAALAAEGWSRYRAFQARCLALCADLQPDRALSEHDAPTTSGRAP